MTGGEKSKRTRSLILPTLNPAREAIRNRNSAYAAERFDRVKGLCDSAIVLARYLADGPYQFSMAFGRGTFSEFWGVTSENTEILNERRRWLREDEGRYLAVLPEAEELLKEARELGDQVNSPLDTTKIHSAARFFGEHWEPDYLLLKRGADGARLVCGCVCFPSSWALEEKIGRPIGEIHDVVPALNSSVGRQIQTFLERLKPGISWLRSNWGLSRSAERNQHPIRKTPRLDKSVTLSEVFFRVEEQSLVALPKSDGILFGIRLRIIPLEGYAGTVEGLKLATALETMPEPMAVYKGLAPARLRIISLLRG